ncbi:MAG TPA: hypothetical protein VEZ90_17780 [Blastocatellia bacterium]|nr:hypothetical protein [Blastocatellia bacterium]
MFDRVSSTHVPRSAGAVTTGFLVFVRSGDRGFEEKGEYNLACVRIYLNFAITVNLKASFRLAPAPFFLAVPGYLLTYSRY